MRPCGRAASHLRLGGAKDNAIPARGRGRRPHRGRCRPSPCGGSAAALRAEYHAADGHITVTVTETDDGLTPMDAASTERAITLLLARRNGMVEMSMDVRVLCRPRSTSVG